MVINLGTTLQPIILPTPCHLTALHPWKNISQQGTEVESFLLMEQVKLLGTAENRFWGPLRASEATLSSICLLRAEPP